MRKDTFTYKGEELHNLYHPYNATYENERQIEIPLIKSVLDKEKGVVLEVGNVLSHYFPISHDVLDKYEVAEGVINEDAAYYKSDKKYDLIISISTLEHIGLDVPEKDNRFKSIMALHNLYDMLSSKGRLIVTIPIGYNVCLDKYLINNPSFFDEIFLFRKKRYSSIIGSTWEITDKLYKADYDDKGTNLLFIGLKGGRT
jgi:hypothetical protein